MTPPDFYIFVIISPLKRTWPFISTNLNSLYPMIICIKYDWIRPAGSGEEFFLIHSFAIISPWRGVISLVWTNLNSLHLRMISRLSSCPARKCFVLVIWSCPVLVGPGLVLVVLFTFVQICYLWWLFQNTLFRNRFYTAYYNQNWHELAFS